MVGEYIDRVYTWEVQNEITRNWYRCADKAIRWPSGDTVRFEIATDITEEKEALLKLKKANDELKKFNSIAVDRKLKMVEMKRTINALHKELHRKPLYDLSFLEDEAPAP